MGQVLHGSATTTATIRRAIQHSQESLRGSPSATGSNQKTVAKWKKRGSVADLPTGPKDPKSTVLSVEEEAIIVPSYTIRCSRSMIASIPCSRQSRTCPARHCTAASNVCVRPLRVFSRRAKL